MPGQDNDRLERFFRKATNRPQLTFSEEDWKKLEARLDAADAAKLASVKTPKKIITALAVALILMSTVGILWRTSDRTNTDVSASDVTLSAPSLVSPPESVRQPHQPLDEDDHTADPAPHTSPTQKSAILSDEKITKSGSTDKWRGLSGDSRKQVLPADDQHAVPTAETMTQEQLAALRSYNEADKTTALQSEDERLVAILQRPVFYSDLPEGSKLVRPLASTQVHDELIALSAAIADGNSAIAERNKQRAPIELPGAEEADFTGRQTMVEEEHASDKKEEHVAKPRLSLLLSYAPDFSGTSLSRYSAPGKAFGAMIHYHVKSRWSVSAGVIQNNKTYTGDGEEYTPPKGYWKYYTNGVIPESIDGSCRVLEFPLMVQYTVLNRGRNRWVLGAGTSSYLMQSESYRYHFDQPNPGAKEGWDSKGTSRFLFNMLNFTVGYEHQVVPGLMLGIEPYLKLPMEKIGWSSLRLYSSGASITLRYTLIGRKQAIPVASRSRGPD